MQSITTKDLKVLYNQLKRGAEKRNIPFELTLNDLNDLSFPLTCPILEIELGFNTGSPKDNSYSIDRIDSSKGYTRDNIIVVSNRVNTIKSNASIDELIKIAEYYQQFN